MNIEHTMDDAISIIWKNNIEFQCDSQKPSKDYYWVIKKLNLINQKKNHQLPSDIVCLNHNILFSTNCAQVITIILSNVYEIYILLFSQHKSFLSYQNLCYETVNLPCLAF